MQMMCVYNSRIRSKYSIEARTRCSERGLGAGRSQHIIVRYRCGDYFYRIDAPRHSINNIEGAGGGGSPESVFTKRGGGWMGFNIVAMRAVVLCLVGTPWDSYTAGGGWGGDTNDARVVAKGKLAEP